MIISRDGTLIHTRSDTSPDSQSQSQSNDISSRNQIIIGVVVGGVAFIAITAGIILFVHIRKRKQDRQPKPDQHQQLLPLHIPPAYKATSTILPCPERPDSYNYSDSDSTSPPAYQAALPVYDPSKYQSLNRESIIGPGPALMNLNPVYYPDPPARRSFQVQPMDNRLTIQRLSGATSVEFTRRQSGMSLDCWSRPSNDSSTLWSNGGMSQSRSLSPESGDNNERRTLSVAGDEEGNRRPRRPKPVLSRLMTNFS